MLKTMKTHLEKELETDKKIRSLRSVLGLLLAIFGIVIILSVWLPFGASVSLLCLDTSVLIVIYILERKRYREIKAKYLG